MAAALAVPVLALLHLPTVARRSFVARVAVAVGLVAVIGVGALAASATRPAPATGAKPRPILPVPAAALRTDVRAGQSRVAPISIAFTTPMDADSVRAALSIEPQAAVQVRWNTEHTVLTVEPLGRWASGTYHTITIAPGALAEAGQPLATPVRAAFLTRPAAVATIAASGRAGNRIRTDSGFTVEFSAAPDGASLAGALLVDPPVAGSWSRVAADGPGVRYAFTPVGRLAADTTYEVSLAPSVRDPEGVPIRAEALSVRTATAPSVVRFRPAAKATDVERGAVLSVRFSEPMDRSTTAAAFRATVGKTAIKGAISWSEGDRELVFDPAKELGFDQKVAIRLDRTATSRLGVPLSKPAVATFSTVPKPPPAAPAAPRATTGSGGSSGGGSSAGSGGGSVGSGTWAAVESYYLRLMNCTRTGGTVTSSGGCSSPGGRNVAPLRLDSGISSKVSRPYARLLATGNQCSHFVGGNPGDRLRRAGYTSYIWAENLGCRSGDAYAAVLGSHLFFQAEKSYNGGHYVNMMNAKYDRAGIGVWVSGGRVRLVVDFYHPR